MFGTHTCHFPEEPGMEEPPAFPLHLFQVDPKDLLTPIGLHHKLPIPSQISLCFSRFHPHANPCRLHASLLRHLCLCLLRRRMLCKDCVLQMLKSQSQLFKENLHLHSSSLILPRVLLLSCRTNLHLQFPSLIHPLNTPFLLQHSLHSPLSLNALQVLSQVLWQVPVLVSPLILSLQL